jgi:hypothetical protein
MNKNSFLTLIALILTFILVSCAGESNPTSVATSDSLTVNPQQDSVAEIDRNAEDQHIEVITYLDTTVRVDGDYTITCITYYIDGQDEDDVCTIKNIKTGVVIDSLGYVTRIKDGYIFNESSDEVAGYGILTLIKIEDERVVHTFYFKDYYELDKDKLKIYEIVRDEEYLNLNKSKLPPIPEQQGDIDLSDNYAYAEQRIFYFKTGEIKNTGKFITFYEQ